MISDFEKIKRQKSFWLFNSF